ncbi:MAG: hypothetical protein HUK03_02025 [Bacteroidaceae bacterium]|nr:hypothetical protein [Bacteroidaceae bacterium]
MNIRNPKPVLTARKAGAETLVIQIANPKLKINVPKAGLTEYKKALVAEEGEYTEHSTKATIPYMLGKGNMATTKNRKEITHTPKTLSL